MSAAMAVATYSLPWHEDGAERTRLVSALALATLIVGTFGVIVPMIELPVRTPAPVAPQAFVRLELEPPAPVEIPEPPPPPPVVEPVRAVAEPVPAVAKPTPTPVRKPKPGPDAAQIRDEAAIAELSAFADAFADMREPVDETQLKPTGTLSRGSGEAAVADRAVIAAEHGRRTLNVASASTSAAGGGVALSGRENTRIEMPRSGVAVRATGVRGKGAGGAADGAGTGDDLLGGRSIEEIRRVFDANKGSLFALYHQALRDLPGIEGKVVLELVISPAGQVTDCRIVANELGSEALAGRLADRVRGFRFESRDVLPTTVTFPVHFLPS